MTYVQKQVTVLVCDLCIQPIQKCDDIAISKTIYVGDDNSERDICMECWEKIRQLVDEEQRSYYDKMMGTP